MIMVISLMTALLVFILYGFFDLAINGARGKRGFLKKYYASISGNQIKKRTPIFDLLLSLNIQQKRYTFDAKKYLTYALPACLVITVFIYFFFRSWPFAIFISAIGLFYPRTILKGVIEKRRNLLNRQLREAMFSINSSLVAGSSMNKAIERSVHDLERLFRNSKDAPIVHEFRRIAEDISIGYPLDEALISFRDRVQLEDVDDFVNATLVAMSRGGNLVEVFNGISRVISEKIEIQNDIRVLTAGKRMEAKILSVLPIAVVACLTLLSPDYMEPMYNTWVGRMLMFIGLALICVNYLVSRSIVKIDV